MRVTHYDYKKVIMIKIDLVYRQLLKIKGIYWNSYISRILLILCEKSIDFA